MPRLRVRWTGWSCGRRRRNAAGISRMRCRPEANHKPNGNAKSGWNPEVRMPSPVRDKSLIAPGTRNGACANFSGLKSRSQSPGRVKVPATGQPVRTDREMTVPALPRLRGRPAARDCTRFPALSGRRFRRARCEAPGEKRFDDKSRLGTFAPACRSLILAPFCSGCPRRDSPACHARLPASKMGHHKRSDGRDE